MIMKELITKEGYIESIDSRIQTEIAKHGKEDILHAIKIASKKIYSESIKPILNELEEQYKLKDKYINCIEDLSDEITQMNKNQQPNKSAEEFLKNYVKNDTIELYILDSKGELIETFKPLVRALEEYSKQSNWISVEDRFPEAGKKVIALVEREYIHHEKGKQIKKEVIRAKWIPKYFEEDWDNFNGDSEYCEEKDMYYWPESWYESNHYEEVNWMVDDKVTHWQPLPQPPKQ